MADLWKELAVSSIDQVAEVVTSSASIPGMSLSMCSTNVVERFESAVLILTKGLGKDETLSEVSAPIYFLLQVKCPIIGVDVGALAGSIVLMRGIRRCTNLQVSL